MNDHEGCKRGFVWSSRAWYHRPEYGKDIHFGMYADEGGTSGEMSIEWVELAGRSVPLLKVFDDAWSALSMFGDLLQKMAEVDNDNISQEQFVEMLLSCGFVDQTEYESPYEPKETILHRELAELEGRVKEIKSKLGQSK